MKHHIQKILKNKNIKMSKHIQGVLISSTLLLTLNAFCKNIYQV